MHQLIVQLNYERAAGGWGPEQTACMLLLYVYIAIRIQLQFRQWLFCPYKVRNLACIPIYMFIATVSVRNGHMHACHVYLAAYNELVQPVTCRLNTFQQMSAYNYEVHEL